MPRLLHGVAARNSGYCSLRLGVVLLFAIGRPKDRPYDVITHYSVLPIATLFHGPFFHVLIGQIV